MVYCIIIVVFVIIASKGVGWGLEVALSNSDVLNLMWPCNLVGNSSFLLISDSTECKESSRCQRGEYIEKPATETSNTVCARCNGLSEYQDEEGKTKITHFIPFFKK